MEEVNLFCYKERHTLEARIRAHGSPFITTLSLGWMEIYVRY